jgi:hypothetical protein
MHNSKVDLLQFTSYSDLDGTQQKKPPHSLQILAREGSQVIEPRHKSQPRAILYFSLSHFIRNT